jgi:outer membrane protein
MVVSKKYFYIYSLIAVFIWIGGSGPALGQEPLSFYGAINKALENNYQIQIASKSLQIAENNNNPGAAGMWPTITLSANQNNNYTDQTKPTERTTIVNSVAPAINLNWLLFGGFAVKINRQRLAELVNLSEGMMAVVVENTLQAVILAYQRALLEKERLAVTNEVMKLSFDQYQYEKVRKSTGSGTAFDLQQALTSYLQDSSTHILQGINYRNAMRNLSIIMGEEHSIQYTLTDSFKPIDHTFKLEDLFTNLESNSQILKNQYINQQLIQFDLEQSKSQLYPTFSLNAGSSYTFSSTKIDEAARYKSDPLFMYGNFTLSFNLFNGGNVKRAIENARIEIEQAELETKELEKQVKMQLTSTFDLYNVRKQLFEVSVENVALTKMNLDLARDRYKLGTINSINLREVQLSYLNASLAKLQSIYDIMDTYTEIMRATGGIVQEFSQENE